MPHSFVRALLAVALSVSTAVVVGAVVLTVDALNRCFTGTQLLVFSIPVLAGVAVVGLAVKLLRAYTTYRRQERTKHAL